LILRQVTHAPGRIKAGRGLVFQILLLDGNQTFVFTISTISTSVSVILVFSSSLPLTILVGKAVVVLCSKSTLFNMVVIFVGKYRAIDQPAGFAATGSHLSQPYLSKDV
jgi:hypothetical protein